MKALALAAAASLALLAPAAGHAAFPSAHARIVYAAEDLGGLRLSLIDPDSGKITEIGVPLSLRGGASVAPDGTTFALTATFTFPGETPTWSIFAGGLVGNFQTVVQDTAPVDRASWSPDGKSIVYASRRDGDWDLYRQNADGSGGAVNLTASSPADERNPRVGPDGRIAFESNRMGSVDVFTMNADGSGARDLTPTPTRETLGDWSPDGARIVYSSNATGADQLYVVGSAGGTPARITHDSGEDTRAAWSPTGDRIAFSSDRDGDDEVFMVAPDGTGERQLTSNSSEDLVQDWQALRDLSPPVVHALAGTGVRGRAFALRFRVSEDSGQAEVEVGFSYETANGGGEAGGSGPVDASNPSRIHSFVFPAELARRLPRTIRFCVDALDPSANESTPSCARFTFKRRKR